MALRGLAGEMARGTAGLWKVVAEVVDPKPASPAGARSVPETAAVEVEPGQMLVPIDAWTRILEQVGHVHEAGQQVADARERAARAETENEFLKEQLRDLKAQKSVPRRPAAPSVDSAAPGLVQPEPASRAERVRRVRLTASRWISPR